MYITLDCQIIKLQSFPKLRKRRFDNASFFCYSAVYVYLSGEEGSKQSGLLHYQSNHVEKVSPILPHSPLSSSLTTLKASSSISAKAFLVRGTAIERNACSYTV